MSRKIYFWMLPFALGVMLYALDRAATCSAQEPDGPPAMIDGEDDWDVPPPGPQDEKLPPKAERRPGNRVEGNRPPDGAVPPFGRRHMNRPEGAPPEKQPGRMMPPGGPFGGPQQGPGGPPQGPGGPPQGPGGPPQGPEGLPQGPQNREGYDRMMPGGGNPYGYGPRGPYGYPGRMRGPFFGGGLAFPSERDAELLELTDKEHELEMKAGTLTEEFRRAEGEKREKIKVDLRETVVKQFELRQERRRLELKRLEEGLKRMREVIERRDKARDQIINRHLSELLGEEDELRF